MSIGCLLAMPGARGLFHKAILESGVGSTARPLDVSRQVAVDMLDLLGLKPGDTEALRSLAVEKLLQVQVELTLKSPGGITPVAPVIDGKVLPVPLDAIRAGSAPGVPVVIGTNLEEWKLFAAMAPDRGEMDDAALVKVLQQWIPGVDVARLVAAYRDARAKRREPTSPSEIFSAIQTDFMFRIPAIRVLEARVQNKQAAYSYLFNWKSPAMGGSLGACHALEIGFVFGNYDALFCGSGPDADKLSKQIQDAWIAFARTGNPATGSLGEWPQYGTARKTMILGKDSHVEEAPYDEERRIWDAI
jgi:para-nitrobenzyl esterase